MLDEFLCIQKALPLRTDQANKGFWSLCSQQRKVGELPARVYRKLYESLVAPVFDYMEPQFGHTTARQQTWKRSKTELADFLGSWEKTPPGSSCRRRVDAHHAKTCNCRHCHFGITYYKKGSTELAEGYILGMQENSRART